MVASSPSGPAPAVHAAARAAARAPASRRSSAGPRASKARRTLEWDGTGPNRPGLAPQRLEVGQTLGPIGQCHRQLSQAHAWIMAMPRHLGQHLAEGGGQASAVGHLTQPDESRP